MGKPYAAELEKLDETYAWCLTGPEGGLGACIRSFARLPLIAVGSGGSLTAAHLAAFLHTSYTGRLARATTPYDLLGSPAFLGDVGVLILSAGGSNPDILRAFTGATEREPGYLGFLTTRVGSPLAAEAKRFPWVKAHEFDLPVRKDGFLATNSLLATGILLSRAYRHNWPLGEEYLPASLDLLLHPGRSREDFLCDLERDCRVLWERQTLVVLHGNATQPAAADLESKFTEAALGNLQIADYRNFGHGRHHWLARHGPSSAVLALVTPRDAAIAEKTMALLPKDIPTVRLDFPEGVNAALAALAVSLYLTGLAGVARGIDPGRPKVPPFGRKLYHLESAPAVSVVDETMPESTAIRLERKAGVSAATLLAQGNSKEWHAAHDRFVSRLSGATFRAAVFDYDGTLCAAAERYTGPRREVTEHLLRLLRSGLYLGIATGRGRSVRKDLRERIDDPSLWQRVLLGYHNGAEIGFLDDDTQPPGKGAADSTLARVVSVLKSDPRLSGNVSIEASNLQVTLELLRPEMVDEVWEIVERAVREHATPGVAALRSSHSVDLLAPGVGKRNVVQRIREEIETHFGGGDVLCVGDRGRWPGNDFALLQEPYSLSVDEVSRDPETCWNLARPGSRCVEACLEYLAVLTVGPSGAKLSI
jgi:hydroxymethylpyrimidine pyrophosphatase-like HAD family hydrolase/fructoselysine-6-P-deglycase FrlB-like protein